MNITVIEVKYEVSYFASVNLILQVLPKLE